MSLEYPAITDGREVLLIDEFFATFEIGFDDDRTLLSIFLA